MNKFAMWRLRQKLHAAESRGHMCRSPCAHLCLATLTLTGSCIKYSRSLIRRADRLEKGDRTAIKTPSFKFGTCTGNALTVTNAASGVSLRFVNIAASTSLYCRTLACLQWSGLCSRLCLAACFPVGVVGLAGVVACTLVLSALATGPSCCLFGATIYHSATT